MIDSIKAQPSAAELQVMREMIMAEMYKAISSMPQEQQEMMKKQINIGFVAQNWAKKYVYAERLHDSIADVR